MKQLSLVSAALLLTACTSNSEFQQRYDRYFPTYSQYMDGINRRYYDTWLFGPPPPKTYSEEVRHLYCAFRGDASAAHLLFSETDRNSESDDEMGWITDCAVLLLRLGDDKFSEFLAREDPKTREAVGEALDAQIDFQKDPFPKTRALYHSHWRPHGHPYA
jgi:hypothetical protein